MIFEYLKKNRWELFNKWAINSAILLVALLSVIGILLLTPVGLGLIALFSTSPVGFFFLFLAGLLVLSAIASVVWLSVEKKWITLNLPSPGKHRMADEKNDTELLLNADEAFAYSSTLSRLRLSKKGEEIFEDTVKNKVPKNTNSHPTLEEYFKENEKFISEVRKAILDKTFKKPEIFNSLEKKFKALKKQYYQLALLYHPDKNSTEKEEHFKQLRNYYESIEKTFERLKTLRDEKDIWEILREMDEKLENLDKGIKKCWEILNEIEKIRMETKKYHEEMKKDTEEMKKLNSQLKDLIDQDVTIDSLNPEMQFLPLFSASLQEEQQPPQQTNLRQTNANLNAGPPVPTGHFSDFWSALTSIIPSFTKTQQSIDNSDGPEQTSFAKDG